MENKKNEDPMPFAIGIGGLLMVAVYSQKQMEIKHWFYTNLMMLVFAAFVMMALIVVRVLHKMKKREADLIKRMQAVRSVKPGGDETDYYKRRD